MMCSEGIPRRSHAAVINDYGCHQWFFDTCGANFTDVLIAHEKIRQALDIESLSLLPTTYVDTKFRPARVGGVDQFQ